MASPTSYIHGAKQSAREGRAEARSESLDGRPALLQFGKVKVVQVNNLYQIAALDDVGAEIVPAIDYVATVPKTATLEVNDVVLLMRSDGHARPVALALGGGGGGSCLRSIQELGCLYE